MNIIKQRAINKVKIAQLTKLLEAESKSKVVLEEKAYRLKPTEANLKKAIKTIVSKKITAGEALLLLQEIDHSSYALEDVEISDLFAKYGIKIDYTLTGGMEQLLDKIGYVLRSNDIDLLSKTPFGENEIGSILCKLFYSGKAQRFVSDEFIKAVADKITTGKFMANKMLDAITGGDPIYPYEFEKKGGQFFYYQKRSKPLIDAFKKMGMVKEEEPVRKVRGQR